MADGKLHSVKGPIKELDRIQWTGRRVTILYDSDAADKPQVRRTAGTRARTRKAGCRRFPGRTVNLEIGILRRIMRREKCWARIAADGSEQYVFPACQNDKVDPTRPMTGWRTAWRSLTKAAGLDGLRFHDLRHHPVTEVVELGLSDETITSIAGHVSREMLSHYSHIRFQAKRRALDMIGTPKSTDAIPAAATVPPVAVPQVSQIVS